MLVFAQTVTNVDYRQESGVHGETHSENSSEIAETVTWKQLARGYMHSTYA